MTRPSSPCCPSPLWHRISQLKCKNASCSICCRVKGFHQRSSQYEQILKKNEQMFALLAITTALCPAALADLSEVVLNLLQEKCALFLSSFLPLRSPCCCCCCCCCCSPVSLTCTRPLHLLRNGWPESCCMSSLYSMPIRLHAAAHVAARKLFWHVPCRYGEKRQRMVGGDQGVFDELFSYACPKFITASPPNYDAPVRFLHMSRALPSCSVDAATRAGWSNGRGCSNGQMECLLALW